VSSGVWSFDAVPQAPAAARHAIGQVAERYKVVEAVRDAMELAVSEAVTNAVVHAYRGPEPAGRIELEATLTEDGLCVYVRDDGAGLTPVAESPGLGLGLPLMANLSERFEVRNRNGGGTEIVLHFPVP
jgi:serine/threonine-protein kinase RsbW